MDTCRWTFNRGVEHFQRTGEFNARDLRDLYVTKKTNKELSFPEHFKHVPKWVYDTPKSFRANTLRKLQTNIKAAHTNLRNKNINRFTIKYNRKKENKYFTFSEDGDLWQIDNEDDKTFLSITGLKRIPIKIDREITINCAIDILCENDFWYAVIPDLVMPEEVKPQNTCIALDPGIKSFMTGFDLKGNTVHIGRGNQNHLKKLKQRRDRSSQEITDFKRSKGSKSYKEYKSYTRAKRTFYSTIAKIKNSVKELHYKTINYLTKTYDTIILPIFKTQKMVKKGCKKLNDAILSLNHFSFRQMLKAKCEVMGKSLVVCSEVYTTKTCGKCGSLTETGSSDIYECGSCSSYKAGRDENGAFNILRFVLAGSLDIYEICN